MACHRPAMDGLPDLTKDAKAALPLRRLTRLVPLPVVRSAPLQGRRPGTRRAPAQAVRARCGLIVKSPRAATARSADLFLGRRQQLNAAAGGMAG